MVTKWYIEIVEYDEILPNNNNQITTLWFDDLKAAFTAYKKHKVFNFEYPGHWVRTMRPKCIMYAEKPVHRPHACSKIVLENPVDVKEITTPYVEKDNYVFDKNEIVF